MDEKKTSPIETPEQPQKEEETTKVFDTETVAGSQKPVKKSKTGLFVFIALLVIALVVAAYFLFIKKSPTTTGASAEIQQMQELTQEVQGMENEVKQKENKLLESMDQYKQKTGGQSLEVNAMNLSADEKKLLEEKIAAETDVSIKSLLKDILDKNNEIQELKDKITEIEKKLPVPHVVKTGENHFKIALDFLVKEKGLEKKQAKELIERTALMDTLVPGFKVYSFYTGEEYGTAVTQGTAAISPNTLIRTAKKVLVDARDEAISQRDQLSLDIKALEEKRDEIVRQLDMLAKEKESLLEKVGELNEQVNSLFYLVDTEKSLKDKQVLKGGFLRSTKLKDISPELFTTSLDLRSNATITISAADLGISKIKEITLFPKFFTAGTDYKIEIAPDKLTATLTILATSKFKNNRLVVSIN